MKVGTKSLPTKEELFSLFHYLEPEESTLDDYWKLPEVLGINYFCEFRSSDHGVWILCLISGYDSLDRKNLKVFFGLISPITYMFINFFDGKQILLCDQEEAEYPMPIGEELRKIDKNYIKEFLITKK